MNTATEAAVTQLAAGIERAAEPNPAALWSARLQARFNDLATTVAIDMSAILTRKQQEAVLRPAFSKRA